MTTYVGISGDISEFFILFFFFFIKEKKTTKHICCWYTSEVQGLATLFFVFFSVFSFILYHLFN